MKNLIVKTTPSAVIESNLDAWRADVDAFLASFNQNLETDDDFAKAEGDVKTLKEVESNIKNAINLIKEGTGDINTVINEIEIELKKVAEARLYLDKEVKSKKELIKSGLVDDFLSKVDEHLKEYDCFQFRAKTALVADANKKALDAIKGKRKIDSIQIALDELYMHIQKDIEKEAELARRENEQEAKRQAETEEEQSQLNVDQNQHSDVQQTEIPDHFVNTPAFDNEAEVSSVVYRVIIDFNDVEEAKTLAKQLKKDGYSVSLREVQNG